MHYLGLRHKHEREEGIKVQPKRSSYVVLLDKVTFVAGIVGPFTVLPQIYSIFATHSATGVSLLSWLLMFIVTFPWILYGVAHKDVSIIASFILWEIANALVVVGVLMYS